MTNETLNALPADSALSGRRDISAEPVWLRQLRETGASAFAQKGLPQPDDEEWRFTPLKDFVRHEFVPAQESSCSRADLASIPTTFGGWRAVVVNGVLRKDLSTLPSTDENVRIYSLADILTAPHEAMIEALGSMVVPDDLPFASLNASKFADIIFIHVAQGCVVDRPLELVLWTDDSGQGEISVHPRVLLIAEQDSQVTLIEVYSGRADATYFVNPVVEVDVRRGAKVWHYRVQRDSENAFHIGVSEARVRSGGGYNLFSVAYGAKLSRADLRVRLVEPQAEGLLYGLYRTDADQLADLHSLLDHAAPHCSSWEVVKGILEGRSRGVFNGRIIVRPGAQKTDAKQTNKNLLLSRDAVVNANPQLEIYADDVKCTHGATVGHLDDQALFYLRSRGISSDDARGLLTYAFANDILRHVHVPLLRQWLERSILEVEHVAFDKDLLEVK